MAEISGGTVRSTTDRQAFGHDPIGQLSEVIAGWFCPEPATAPGAAAVDVELQPAPGAELQIERHGDVLTVRGAVLTIRRGAPEARSEPQKYYF